MERLRINLAFPHVRQLLSDPPMHTVRGLISRGEAARLIGLATPRLRASGVQRTTPLERERGGVRREHGRESATCVLHHRSVPALMERAESLVALPRTYFEWPQVTRYAVGDCYPSHIDAFDLATESGRSIAGRGGQRVCTLLIYLSDCAAGGLTRFARAPE